MIINFQKSLRISKLVSLSIISGITFLVPIYALKAEAAPAEPKSFEEWCNQKDSLPLDTKKTVEAMLSFAETIYRNEVKDCKQANSVLSSKSNRILALEEYQITDITPIASLTHLTTLSLHNNQITDITPLTKLTNLTTLYLEGNQITDITPLTKLTNLTTIFLFNNQITNITPLAKLAKLTAVRLDGNPIKEKICPLKPESICRF